MYSPLAADSDSRRVPFASLIRTSVAPATAPPLGSVTVPRMRPPVLWALLETTAAKQTAKRASTPIKYRSTPRSAEWLLTLIDPTPDEEFCFRRQFLRLPHSVNLTIIQQT